MLTVRVPLGCFSSLGNFAFDLNYPETYYNFPSIYNPKHFDYDEDSFNPSYNHVINDWQDGSLYVSTKNSNAISPQLYLLFVLKHLFEATGYHSFGNVFEHEILKKAMLFNNFSLDKLVPTQFEGEMHHKFPFYDQYVLLFDELIDPGDHYDPGTGKYYVDKEGNYFIDVWIEHIPESLPTDAERGVLYLYYGNQIISQVERVYPFGKEEY